MFFGRRREWRTEYEYDDNGRLVASTTVETSPEWDDDDRGLAQAYLAEEANRCSGCGLPLDETTKAEHQARYQVPDPHRCHACTALNARAGRADAGDVANLHFSVGLGPPIRLRSDPSP